MRLDQGLFDGSTIPSLIISSSSSSILTIVTLLYISIFLLGTVQEEILSLSIHNPSSLVTHKHLLSLYVMILYQNTLEYIYLKYLHSSTVVHPQPHVQGWSLRVLDTCRLSKIFLHAHSNQLSRSLAFSWGATITTGFHCEAFLFCVDNKIYFASLHIPWQ